MVVVIGGGGYTDTQTHPHTHTNTQIHTHTDRHRYTETDIDSSTYSSLTWALENLLDAGYRPQMVTVLPALKQLADPTASHHAMAYHRIVPSIAFQHTSRDT
jgi:hypothetical protein